MNQENKKQLAEWVKGNPMHNKVDDECCPDFSCCGGDLASKDERLQFKEAVESKNEELQMSVLATFLNKAISKMSDKKVYITKN